MELCTQLLVHLSWLEFPNLLHHLTPATKERESVVCTFNLGLGLYSRVGKSHFIYLLFFLFFFSFSLLGVLFTSTLSWSNRMFYFVLVPEKLLVISSIIFINPHLPHFASIPVFPFHSWILIVPCMESNLLISHSLGGLAAGSVDLTSIVFFSFSSSFSLLLFLVFYLLLLFPGLIISSILFSCLKNYWSYLPSFLQILTLHTYIVFLSILV